MNIVQEITKLEHERIVKALDEKMKGISLFEKKEYILKHTGFHIDISDLNIYCDTVNSRNIDNKIIKLHKKNFGFKPYKIEFEYDKLDDGTLCAKKVFFDYRDYIISSNSKDLLMVSIGGWIQYNLIAFLLFIFYAGWIRG